MIASTTSDLEGQVVLLLKVCAQIVKGKELEGATFQIKILKRWLRLLNTDSVSSTPLWREMKIMMEHSLSK